MQFLDLIKEAYDFANWWFLALTATDDHFPLKKQSWGVYVMRKILAPFKRYYFLYDNFKDKGQLQEQVLLYGIPACSKAVFR